MTIVSTTFKKLWNNAVHNIVKITEAFTWDLVLQEHLQTFFFKQQDWNQKN